MKKTAFALVGLLALAACDVSSTGGGSYNRVVDITNSTGSTMTRFYASNTNENTWGPDQLGTSVLRSGQYITLDFDDGTGACMFDFKASFTNGQTLIRRGVNVCAVSSYDYY